MGLSRVLAALVVVAVAAGGAAWRVSASQGSPALRAAAATNRANLQRELQRFMRGGRASPLPPAGPGPCFVAGRSCSLRPCVLFIGQRQSIGAPATTSSAVTLVPRPALVPDQIPASGACRGRIGTPRTFRVSAH